MHLGHHSVQQHQDRSIGCCSYQQQTRPSPATGRSLQTSPGPHARSDRTMPCWSKPLSMLHLCCPVPFAWQPFNSVVLTIRMVRTEGTESQTPRWLQRSFGRHGPGLGLVLGHCPPEQGCTWSGLAPSGCAVWLSCCAGQQPVWHLWWTPVTHCAALSLPQQDRAGRK